MELVFQDKQEGGKIHASIRRTLIYKFQNEISEGKVYGIQNFSTTPNGGIYRTSHHPYKINFQFGTKVTLLDAKLVPDIKHDYIPLSVLSSIEFDQDYLVNILRVLVGVGTERELQVDENKTKLNVIAIESDGFRIECTLFGTYVDKLNGFLSIGEVQNVVISIEFAKVKSFQDSTTFVLFDGDATALINKGCANILQGHDKNFVSEHLAKEFAELVDKSLLFIIESRNDQTFKLE
ncbi:uncharacterized protein LOC114194940 [Vigna unguiculata]|uniref:uncharacterized protein LOC114194940 n=1 Tax=Vigna unguiculata TaxID=3917 RepID=UPI001016E0FE|nr:uncharacterized protein LOC114194940 [Vigna unguiculata]